MLFRDLRADEIECRIGTAKEGKGVSLLLYKDARCDMNILDETVGEMNWQKRYGRENANCEVGIYCEERGEWVWKEDTGTESKTEAEKGLASDSFKRACFCWGIGRELYTAPFIWINGANKYDRFWVKEMEIESKKITRLVICACDQYGNRTDTVAYEYPRKGGSAAPRAAKATAAGKRAPEQESTPTAAERAADAYPERDIMIAKLSAALKPAEMQKWLDMWGVGALADARDEALMGMYRFYEQKGKV